MKRILLSTILIVIGLSAFSQSPSRSICLRPAYPLLIGESTIDGLSYDNNGLYMYDILLDSLPQYEIGHIFAQTVSYTKEGHGFYVKADSLHSLNVVYSYELNDPPQGTIEFNGTTGRFKYYPAAEDYKSFVVTFSATNGTKTVSEDVAFNLMPQTAAEVYAFQTQGAMPDATDYIIVAEDSTMMMLNYETRKARGISISGKEIMFDDDVKNKVWGLNGRKDIYELNLYAERVVVRSSLSFPQTNITIYAKELFFEDHDTVFASINTSPVPFETLDSIRGKHGANAGNITLYIKELKGNIAKRLILNGAKGQSTNRNGTPGNGGNGGTLTSTIDVSSYCDFARGSAGVRYDVTSDESNNPGTVIASGSMGTPGCLELIDRPYAYIHPKYISSILRQVNDAYINNFTEYTYKICKEYSNLIEAYRSSIKWENRNREEQAQLQNNLTEIGDILLKLEQGLDYFGNPKGWVPLLSFEALLKNYDNEIDRAIPTLYMNYWLSHVDQTLENMVAVQQVAVKNKESEIQSCQNLMNAMVLAIPKLQDKIKEVEAEIKIVNQKISEVESRLMAKAKRSVKKKNRIKKAASIFRGVASAVSVCGPWGATIGTAMNYASNIVFATKTVQQYTGGDYADYLEGLYNKADRFFASDTADYVGIDSLYSIVKDIPWSTIGDNPKMLSEQFTKFTNVAGPMIEGIKDVSETLSHSSTPQSEVEQVFAALCSEDPEWNELKAEFNRLDAKKNDLKNQLQKTFADISNLTTSLSDGLIALDGLKRDVFEGNSKRDLNAMQYLAKMEQQAKNRLLKYHYYMRKAYEYRLLKPYEGEEFNLVKMFKQFENLGTALGYVEDEAAYEALGSIFRKTISDMVKNVIDEYTRSQPEKTTNIPITITKEQLDAINANGSLTLNLYEQDFGSYFFQDEENIRIVGLGVKYIKAHTVGSASRSRLALDMKHSGISQYRKDGQIYWFNHMSTENDNPHFWRTTISFNDVAEETNPETHQNSVAISSLLSTILNNNIENVMLFSRPSVWSDITMSKQVQTNGDDIVIDSLVLELQFDYTLRHPNSNILNIDIAANEDLLPYIACSAEDINGRTNGIGNLYRSYRMNNQSVTFTAVNQYGTYQFKNWTDRSGKVVSEKNDLTVSRSTDQFYRANYERRLPILNVPDTIKVGPSGGTYTVQVGNAGSGVIEMDWYVSDSISSWVHLKGEAEGIDDGTFSFEYDANESGLNRLDSLEIFAPETDIMSKMIYIAQVDDYDGMELVNKQDDSIKIYPNPAHDYICVEGSEISAVNIYTLAGIEISDYKFANDNNVTIDISNLPYGMYIMTIKTSKGQTSKKVMKTY